MKSVSEHDENIICSHKRIPLSIMALYDLIYFFMHILKPIKTIFSFFLYYQLKNSSRRIFWRKQNSRKINETNLRKFFMIERNEFYKRDAIL